MENKENCKLYIVRHGLTDGNVEHRYNGHKDVPLNTTGIEQAIVAREKFKNIHFDGAYSSDLSRAVETSKIVLADRDITLKLKKALREHNFGKREGMTKEEVDADKELKRSIDSYFKLSVEDQWVAKQVEGEESHQETAIRFINELKSLSLLNMGKTIFIGSHGGIMRRFLIQIGYFEKEDFEFIKVDNLAHINLKCDGIEFIIDNVEGFHKRNNYW